jgi:holo-[acyl-carrier protein] synthase
MIFGIGTDIVEIKRIETMTSLDKFASKILSHNEKEFYDSLTNQKQIVYISKQFAAKEAIAKAIGTGIQNDTHFKNIEILRDKNGAPIFNALNKLEKIISDLGITRTHVSLADERDYAIAIALLEK